jgi:hypothetical protein
LSVESDAVPVAEVAGIRLLSDTAPLDRAASSELEAEHLLALWQVLVAADADQLDDLLDELRDALPAGVAAETVLARGLMSLWELGVLDLEFLGGPEGIFKGP